MKKIVIPIVVALITAAGSVVAAYFASDKAKVYITNAFSFPENDSVSKQDIASKNNYEYHPDNIANVNDVKGETLKFQPNHKVEVVQELKSEYPKVLAQAEMIDFELISCKMSGQSLILDFIVESNNDSTKDMTLSPARMIDDMGIEYKSNRIDIAKTGRNRFDLPDQVPVQMSMTFDGISEKIQTVRILEIKGSVSSSGGYKGIEVPLRDFPVH